MIADRASCWAVAEVASDSGTTDWTDHHAVHDAGEAITISICALYQLDRAQERCSRPVENHSLDAGDVW
jgi:hypothetical protein